MPVKLLSLLLFGQVPRYASCCTPASAHSCKLENPRRSMQQQQQQQQRQPSIRSFVHPSIRPSVRLATVRALNIFFFHFRYFCFSVLRLHAIIKRMGQRLALDEPPFHWRKTFARPSKKINHSKLPILRNPNIPPNCRV